MEDTARRMNVAVSTGKTFIAPTTKLLFHSGLTCRDEQRAARQNVFLLAMFEGDGKTKLFLFTRKDIPYTSLV